MPLLRVLVALASWPLATVAIERLAQAVGVGVDTLAAATGPGVLAFIVLAFINEWIVPGRVYRRERARGDRLEDTLLKSAKATQAIAQTLREDE